MFETNMINTPFVFPSFSFKPSCGGEVRFYIFDAINDRFVVMTYCDKHKREVAYVVSDLLTWAKHTESLVINAINTFVGEANPFVELSQNIEELKTIFRDLVGD